VGLRYRAMTRGSAENARQRKPVGLTLTVPAAAMTALAQGDMEAARSSGLTTNGDQGQLASLLSVLQPGDRSFNIIEL
jgi:hypothetical protein